MDGTTVCAGCGRRDFIYGLLAVAATGYAASPELKDFFAALPAPTPAHAIPDKAGAVKVRLVFSIWDEVQVKKTWPNVGFDFRPVMKNITDALNAGVPGVAFLPGMAFDAKGAAAILAEDGKAGDVKGYLVIQMNSWPNALAGIVQAGKPTLFCSFPYSGIGGWDVQNAAMIRKGQPNYAFMSSLDFNDTIGAAKAFETLKSGTGEDFVKAATDYRLAHTPAETGIAAVEGPLACLSPEETLAAVKGKKILSVEGCAANVKAKILKDFGIIVEDVKFDELNAAWEKVPDAFAQAKVDEWKRTARKIAGVSDATLFGCAKQFYGMREVLKAHDAVAISVDCLGGCYTGKLHAYPCLGFMELQDLGLFGTCENDIRSTVAMVVFGAMTKGRMGYISDPAIDSSRRAMIFAHCVATRKFLGPDGPAAPFEIETHSEDRQGASVRSIAPKGYPVTTVQFHFFGDGGKGCALVQTGRLFGNDPDDRACRTKMVVEVTGDFERSYKLWDLWGWHRVTFLGDFKKDVEALAGKIGYRVIYES
ncbi:MAG: hypothetical protein J6U40_08270 [Kiritimatiellae bacterium]|nr:hypothetical protein [Kiritimatiellia bacterium]